MSIEKMTLIDMNGNTTVLDKVLIQCLASGMFQPEHASKLSEYSIGQNPLLRNPYGGLLVKVGEIARELEIAPRFVNFGELDAPEVDRDRLIDVANEFLDAMRKEYPDIYLEQRKIRDEIASYTSAVEMLGHLDQKEIDFDKLWENKFLKIRFGRLPTAAANRLPQNEENPYELVRLDEGGGSTWCMYFTAGDYDDVDRMFRGSGFERLRVPDFVHGTAESAIANLKSGLEQERTELEQSRKKVETYVEQRREALLTLYSKIKFLHDAYDLRRYAVSIRDHFHLIGFVMTKEKDKFLKLFDGIPGVSVKTEPAGADPRLSVPVKLRNNWFAKAFEMFVAMYGAPSYGDIDPTPFVAYTYTVLFGMMFGDLGHGLCVILAGFVMWRGMKQPLGRILERIGVASMFFGFWYGSVFGNETVLTPLFQLMGFPEKPIEVMHPETTNMILIAAVGVGVVIILMSILFNIVIGIKKRNFDRIFLSSNGVSGFVFYSSMLFGVVMAVSGADVFRWWYVLFLIVLPLLLIFFREPITRLAHMIRSENEISHDANLVENSILEQEGFNITELFSSHFMAARFGRIPTDSYKKLTFYQNEPFMLYPVKTDDEYIWLLYAMSASDKETIDAIFHDLYFERIYIPDEDMASPQKATAFIRRCVDERGTPRDAEAVQKYGNAEITRRRSIYERMFPDGFGSFFAETFFEMFEIILSFISNTVSFLRVGGFVLVHAGMMGVVMTLSEMTSGGGTIAIIIFGNVFVMLIEGLIVGIQVLRLEFYEIFSRFYDAGGEEFAPVKASY